MILKFGDSQSIEFVSIFKFIWCRFFLSHSKSGPWSVKSIWKIKDKISLSQYRIYEKTSSTFKLLHKEFQWNSIEILFGSFKWFSFFKSNFKEFRLLLFSFEVWLIRLFYFLCWWMPGKTSLQNAIFLGKKRIIHQQSHYV